MNMQTTNEPKKRTVTRIGDIFCAEIDNQYKVFLQYIAKDENMLCVPVIRVFKKKYPIDYVPEMNEILLGEVNFYSHTVPKIGIDCGLWYKVGTSKDIGDLTTFRFITSNDVGNGMLDYLSKSWRMWTLQGPPCSIGELPVEYYDNTYMGYIFPASDIIHQIEHGKSIFRYPRYK